jgi:phosphopantothenoylcysteine decarboxylase/phosphopantothenate--cysteine ligase
LQNFKNKRVLITAGPTWVPIDNVRVISNIATGETGILLAERLQRLGAEVTLLLGPVGICCLNEKIKLTRFKFFDELKDKLIKELKFKNYNIVIHSAAVADYQPKIYYRGKVKSDKRLWRINLVPTTKIIDLIKKIVPYVFLIGFKFEPCAGKKFLIEKTKKLIKQANLDLAVANTIDKNKYQAYIVNQNRIYGPWWNKNDLAKNLIRVMV